MGEEFVQDFKHVEFGKDLFDHVKRVSLSEFLYDDIKRDSRVIGSMRNGVVLAEQGKC